MRRERKGLVGRARSEDVGAEALRLTGARTVRWIPKGAMVTMDYREDRVNLHLDGKGKVVRVACG
ncbi:MAG TPA: I78 family peptidase inhibitor [Allosphingosinicella sp.]|nr:I78 family peptidase inhibitor [Allosphingosinicella sp.]